MRKITAIILSILMVMLLLPTTALAASSEPTSGSCGSNVTWKLDSKGVLTISGSGDMSYKSWFGDLRIKSVVIKEGVTSISPDAFSCCTNLKSVTLPSTLKEIGEWAFNGCENVETAYITDLEAYCNIKMSPGAGSVFSYSPGTLYLNGKPITDLVIPDGVTRIYSGAFGYNAVLKKVTVPSSVKVIDETAFWHNEKLENVVLQRGLESIGLMAFDECPALKEITIPIGVKSIANDAFSQCINLKEIVFDGNAPSMGKNTFSGVQATVKYPKGNSTWTTAARDQYGGTLTWEAYTPSKLDVPVVKVSNAATGVKVTWDKVVNATSYKIYRKVSGGSWTELKNGVKGTSYTDTTAKSGKVYYYAARAVNDTVSSSYKSSSSIRYLSAPSVTLIGTTNGIQVKWNKVTGASTYTLLRKVSGGSWTEVKTKLKGTSYTDKTVKNGKKYQYAVKAVNGKQISSYQASGSMYYLPAPKVTLANTSSGVAVSWGKVTGAQKYEVYRSNDGKSWKKLTTTTSRSYTDKKATAGKSYYYTVKAYRKVSGKAVYSGFETNKRIVRLKQPSVKVSAVKGGVKVSWGKVTGAQKYEVYRSTDGKTWKKIKTTASRSYTDKAAKKGTKYYYTVKAYKSLGGTKYYSSFKASKAVKRTR